METCKCRVFCGHTLLAGIDNHDAKEILYEAQLVFHGCPQHLGNCPAGNKLLFQIRNSLIGELRDEHGQDFNVVCKQLVQYCVEQRISDPVMAEALYKEDHLKRNVVAVGEYANTWEAAHHSLLRVLSNLMPMNHHPETTITHIDLPTKFKNFCSGCSLPRDESSDPAQKRFTYDNEIRRVRQESQSLWTGSFECKYCLCRYNQMRSLVAHLKSIHGECVYACLDERPYQCPDCGQKCKNGYSLNRHWETQHERFERSVGGKDCYICGVSHEDHKAFAIHRTTFAHRIRATTMASESLQRIEA